ncbi:39S ribosomal protein L10, mitochondrial [Daktulosphaira vitifoliae]|uniref:39S ribosomal protein L10, mitochondrial n=1 Tax=Daktulosphaira vitifoliae TaxID=58002 RepID=UPI0021AAC7E3|nr:39S ribosomal protein L10, mitochondrial [Daktulosphaira vitifoliae]
MLSSSVKVICTKTFIPTVISVRHRRINVQKPRAPHHYRATINAIIQPKFDWPIPHKMPWTERCPKPLVQKFKSVEDNPYERILAKEVRELFEQSAMVAVFHKNPVNAEKDFKSYKTFKMSGMNLTIYGKSTLKVALTNTNYEAVLQLFHSHSSILFSSTLQVPKLLQMIKKMPHLILLAGIVDGKFLSKTQLEDYASLGTIDNARAHLVGLLDKINNRCLHRIGQTQLSMAHYLEEYGKSLAKNNLKDDTSENFS